MNRLYFSIPIISALMIFCLMPLDVVAQNKTFEATKEIPEGKKTVFEGLTITGEIQSDVLIPQNDTAINAEVGEYSFRTNSYIGLKVQNQYFEVGMRGEYMKQPLQGFEKDFGGAGISNLFLRGRSKTLDITAGDFYEQFGSGLILKTYEERSLGVDNSLRGGRVIINPINGLKIKLLSGFQRYYFKERGGLVSGADLELQLQEYIPFLAKNDWNTTLGVAFVTKHEKDETILAELEQLDTIVRLNLPRNTGAYSLRFRAQKNGFLLDAEYAGKFNDPSYDNNYIFKDGSALLLAGSYSRPGMSLLLQAKRNENMSYRSVRSRAGISSFINHLPPFSMQHSYSLAAHYPYATQQMGEWAFQTEARYLFKRKTTLGGKYGTGLRVNLTHIRPLFNTYEHAAENQKGMTGYQPRFFEMDDEVLYTDFNIELNKQVNKNLSFTAMYMNQAYNQYLVEKHATNGDIIKSNIYILDTKYKFSTKAVARMELQYLNTAQDDGNWLYGMLEVNLFSSLVLSMSDTYNSGFTKKHYPMATASYSFRSHRLQLSYGRTREGISCAGGVCRMVPASKGLGISYNYIF